MCAKIACLIEIYNKEKKVKYNGYFGVIGENER